jgi:hypothetical protein
MTRRRTYRKRKYDRFIEKLDALSFDTTPSPRDPAKDFATASIILDRTEVYFIRQLIYDRRALIIRLNEYFAQMEDLGVENTSR